MVLVKEIVFAGGHLDAIFQYLGALIEIYDNKTELRFEIQRYIGTSSGAILAFLLNIGYTPKEIIRISKCIDLSKFDSHTAKSYLHIFDELGIEDTVVFKRIFCHFLEHKNFDPNIDFKTLYEKTNKHLDIITYCLNKKKTEVLNAFYTPHLPVSQALCMSMAIPLVFKPVKYNNNLYSDAVFLCNFPIDFIKDYTHFLGFTMKSIYEYEENITFFRLLEILYSGFDTEIGHLKRSSCHKSHRIFSFISKKKPRLNFKISHQEIHEHLQVGKKQIYERISHCKKCENETYNHDGEKE